MIIVNGILNDEEILYINELINNLDYNSPIYKPATKINNWYNQINVMPEPFFLNFKNFRKNIKKYIDLNNYEFTSVKINIVEPGTNDNDKFHYDEEDLTTISYLNDGFIGGELLYIENKIEKEFIPTKNKMIIMDSKLFHKVKPVISGKRYSLVCFYKKIKKSII